MMVSHPNTCRSPFSHRWRSAVSTCSILCVILLIGSPLVLAMAWTDFATSGDTGNDTGQWMGRGRGSTWYVDDDAGPGGNGSLDRPYTRIQQALSEADDGDTIRVFEGTYNDTFDITHSINMIGNGSANTTITHNMTGDIVIISSDHVLFQGFTVKGVIGGGMDAAIKVFSDSCVIQDNHCNGKNYQIYLLEAQLNTIEGNNCSGSAGRGIYVKESNYNYIHNNTFSWNEQAGMYLYQSWTNTIENNTCFSNKDGIVVDKGYKNELKFNNCSENLDSGIEIWGTHNNEVHNNDCTENKNYGIYLRKNSYINKVHNNTCLKNFDHGIYSGDCDRNYLVDNKLVNNLIAGLYLYRSIDFTLQRNYCKGNIEYGMYLEMTERIEMAGNTLVENPFFIDDDERVLMGTHSIDETNLVNDRPILYLANAEDTILPGGGGQVILVSCTNITVRDQNCSDGAVGIHMVDCSGIIVENNICSNNSEEGIRILSGDRCEFNYNVVSHNKISGINCEESMNSTFSGNSANANGFTGIAMKDSDNNTLSFNSCNGNMQDGMRITYSEDNAFMNNTSMDNGRSGATFEYSTESLVKNSTSTGNDLYGILLNECSDFILDSNSCSGTQNADMEILRSDSIQLYGNSLLSRGLFIANNIPEEWTTYEIDETNTVQGKPLRFYKNAEDILVSGDSGQVIVVNSTGVVIRGLELNGTVAGVHLAFSKEITVTDCFCSDGIYGIYLYDSEDLLIQNNTCDNNTVTGILFIMNSDNNQLINNSCSGNGANGIEQWGSFNQNNIFSGNKCLFNGGNGMGLYGSYQNEIKENNCSYNNNSGMYIGDDKNTINGNLLVGNLRYGLNLQIANMNDVTRNTIDDNVIAGISMSSSDDNTIQYNSLQENGDGIYMEYSSRDNIAQYNFIVNNTDYGVDAFDSFYPLDATKNWWGHESGPYHPDNNPEGKGDGISNAVHFDPWLVTPEGDESIRTWYVDDDASNDGSGTRSDPFRTIQEALDSASDGEKVLVFNGTYNGMLLVNNSVILEGNSSEDTHIIGEGTGNAVRINADSVHIRNFSITGGGSMDLDAGICVLGSDVHIEYVLVFSNRYGILLDGGENNSVRHSICQENMDGIHGRNVHRSLITDNNCSKNGFYGISFISSNINEVMQNQCNENGNTGISFSSSSYNEISENECNENHYSGIYVGTSSYNILSDNNCSENTFYGVYIYSTSQENVIRNSYFSGNEDGIRIFGSANNTMDMNTCRDGKRGIYIYASERNIISDNVCDENRFAGIYIFESDGNHIDGGSCSGTLGDGIYAIHSNDLAIVNATISGNPLSGIYIMNSTGLDVYNSTISGNTLGLYAGEGSKGVEVHHNRLIMNTDFAVDARDNQNISINATRNWWGNITGPYHVDENPDGTGDRITDHVLFDQWLMKPTIDPYLYVDANANGSGDGTQEKPLRTLNDALNRAEPGNIIMVKGGRYSENISIGIPLWIIGSTVSEIVIDAGGSDHAIWINSDHVTIMGITLSNASASPLHVQQSANVTISNCNLHESVNGMVIDNSTVVLQDTRYDFETTQLLGSESHLYVYNSAKISVINRRSGFIPGAMINITYDLQEEFNGVTNGSGRASPLLLEVYQNASSTIIRGVYHLEIRKDGYLNYSSYFGLVNGIDLICEMEDHVFPVVRISGEDVKYVLMDSELILNGSDSSGMNITWSWDLGDGLIERGAIINHIYRAPGIYPVYLTVKDNLGKENRKGIFVIVENVLPTIFAWPDSVSPFEDGLVTFNASLCEDTVSDEIIISWDFGDGSAAEGIVVTHSYSDKGSYQVVYSVVDLFGAIVEGSFTINVFNRTPWDVSMETAAEGLQYQPHEFNGSAIDTISDSDSLIYSWSFGDGAQGNGRSVSHVFVDPGIHVITLLVSDDDGMTGMYMTSVFIREFEINIIVEPTGIGRNAIIYFTAMAGLEPMKYDYIWYFGDGYHETGYAAHHKYSIPGEFQPYVVVFTEYGNITRYVDPITIQNMWFDPSIIVDGNETIMEDEVIIFIGYSLDIAYGSKISFVWDFGDGTGAVGETQEHSYTESGEYIVTLEISDGITSSSAGTVISILNYPPEADAGESEEQYVVPGELILLDASGSMDSPSDMGSLNYTWFIGPEIYYGKAISYRFTEKGDFLVRLVVTDDNYYTSEVAITYHVVTEDEEKDDSPFSQWSVYMAVTVCFILVYLALVIFKQGNGKTRSDLKNDDRSDGSLRVKKGQRKKMNGHSEGIRDGLPGKKANDHLEEKGNNLPGKNSNDGNVMNSEGLDEWKRKSDENAP